MNKVTSYGVLPLKKYRGNWSIFLVQHGAGHWSFPKGRPEENETDEETARRELKEETDLEVKKFILEPFVEEYYYQFHNELIRKTVKYYPAVVVGKPKIQQEELSNGQWFSIDEALAQITFKQAKTILEKLKAALINL